MSVYNPGTGAMGFQPVVFAFGDSISDTLFNANMWPAWLGLVSGGQGVSFGVAGNNTQDGVNRLINGKGLKWYNWAIGPSDPNPKFGMGAKVYVLLGINDLIFVGGITAATIWANLQTIYAFIETFGAKAIPMTIMPWGNHVNWTAPLEAIRATVNTNIRGGARPFVDLEGLGDRNGSQPKLLSQFDNGDGLHPSPEGSRYIALLAAKV